MRELKREGDSMSAEKGNKREREKIKKITAKREKRERE